MICRSTVFASTLCLLIGIPAASAEPLADNVHPALSIDLPIEGSTFSNVVNVRFHTTGLRIAPVKATSDPDSLLIGHLHVRVDEAPWIWVHATNEPITIVGLSAGHHKITLELANNAHKAVDVKNISFSVERPVVR